MQIIVHGASGRMGQNVLKLLEKSSHTLAAAVSPELTTDAAKKQYYSLAEYDGPADLIIDFSHHAATFDLLAYAELRKLPVMIGTTGQTPAELERIAQAAKTIPVFRSGNMSLGIALLVRLARETAKTFPNAEVEIIEIHHDQKIDVPSGTALMLADAVKSVRPEATYNIGRPENGKRTKEEIGIHALRLGNVVGIHEVHIHTGNQSLTLRHESGSRAMLAEGAVDAARFMVGKAPGLYDMESILNNV